ncbi:gamma-glutamyltransferase family protein [Parasynechococcus marenigrum]|uniref:Gamma-glutamyltranspeptidase n=1 Tax=Parasynechococcus marenigrum (strain WH8102) TaxID=84588 RepID=Q7U6E4_PARMW|nr:gamma-glutamyltransferase family protein [Parasynechococcus marenigrum]CAE07909.1 putative gamma-glutamyltranspeptidase [Parasynechococcus marenigrum WH 8102]
MLRALLLILGLCISSTSAAAAPVSRDDPESADPGQAAISTAAGDAVVVTANPRASRAAVAVLKAGGSAVDALVSAQAVLAVVEPQSSGLAGGGFLMHWDARQQQLQVLDGREVAPLSSRPDDLLQPSGEPLPWREATSRPQAIGVPGTVALLWDVHQQHGRLPWATTLQPAIRLARDGFRPSPRLRRSIGIAQRIGVDHSPAFQALYLPGGQPPPANRPFRNPALARTLELLAKDGGPSFYNGELAQQILAGMAALQTDQPDFRGWSPADLAGYAVVQRSPLCHRLRSYRLCTVPPPSSGGLAVLQTLALLNQSNALSGPADPQTWRLLARAQAWADADRLYWVHDPKDGAIPTGPLLDPVYIQSRAIALQTSPAARPTPGLPPGLAAYPYALPEQSREQGTTHLAIVDGEGNLAAYTSSVETVFGSRHLVAGMVLNNQLTDFAFRPSINGQPVANRRRPGRRPVSSMAPMIVFERGQPLLSVGSPGGRSIPHVLSRVLLASLIWREPPARAVGLPHLSRRRNGLVLEQDPPLPWPVALDQLTPGDQPIRSQRLGSGTALLQKINGRWHGAADPRREGTALSAD